MTQKKKNTKENKIKDKPMSKTQKQSPKTRRKFTTKKKYGKYNDGKYV